MTTTDMVLSVTLKDYFHETITRKEALARLDICPPDAKTRAKIVKEIPKRTEHYIMFADGMFREYAYSGQGTAALVLLLRAMKEGNTHSVFLPIHDQDRYCDGAPRYFTGIDVLKFANQKGKLVANGNLLPTFRFYRNPVTLPVDVSFVAPGKREHNFGCCGACHWVHAKLHISCLNRYCCLGFC
jgi:hypothetical protein